MNNSSILRITLLSSIILGSILSLNFVSASNDSDDTIVEDKTILKTPITNDDLVRDPPNEDDRLDHIRVHMWDGTNAILNIDSFATFNHLSESVPVDDSDIIATGYYDRPQFTLESLPSKDKYPFYEKISQYVNEKRDTNSRNYALAQDHNQRNLEVYDLSVQLFTKDNTLLQTWTYYDCEVAGYWVTTFVNDFDADFRNPDKVEIRDRTDFACYDFRLTIHEQDKSEYTESTEEPDPRMIREIFPENTNKHPRY